MQKLKITSRYNILLLLFLFILLLIRIQFIPKCTNLDKNDAEFVGKITSIERKEEYIKIEVTVNKEKLSGNIYNSNINLEYNDLVRIKGELQEIEENGNFYSFSYKDYAKRHNQFFTIKIDDIEILKENTNIFYEIKNFIVKRINNIKTYDYLHAFLLGDTSYIKEEILESYRTNGISHLFAISGMHLSFFICFIDKILKINNKNIKFIIISLFLLFYSFLVGFTPSVLRASFLYIFTFFTKKPLKSLLLAFILIILLNPYNFFEVGFQLSFLMSFILILFSKKIKEFSKIKQSIYLTTITFITSIPLIITYFNQINILTPIYNLFYISFVSSIVFPISFIVFIIPGIAQLYSILIYILEKSSYFLSNLSFSIWIMREPNTLVFIVLSGLTILTIYFIYSKKYFVIILFFCFLFFYHNINFFLLEDYMTILDVGQGDSLFLHSKNKTILIDTGGNFYTNVTKTKIIPYLKAMGILKIDTLILTHGG